MLSLGLAVSTVLVDYLGFVAFLVLSVALVVSVVNVWLYL